MRSWRSGCKASSCLGFFCRVAPFVAARGLGDAEVYAAVEKSLRKFFGKRGEKVVQENLTAAKRGRDEVFEIPPRCYVRGGVKMGSSTLNVQSSRPTPNLDFETRTWNPKRRSL